MSPNNNPQSIDQKKVQTISSTDILAGYSNFQGVVQALKDGLPERWHTAPDIIGAGRDAVVFSLGDENDFVVRLLHKDKHARLDDSADQIREKAEVGALSRGIPHLEQIIAASLEDNVVISEKAPGMSMLSQPSETLHRITDEQILALINASIAAKEKGIVFDPASANLMYSPELGFTVIDLQLKPLDDYDHPLLAVVDMLNASGVSNRELAEGHAFLDAQNLDESIELMRRFSDLVQTKVDKASLLQALQHEAHMNILANQEVIESRKQPRGIKKLGKFVTKKVGRTFDRLTRQRP